MNDDELITMVREQRTKVPMTVPVEQVISRGRAVRARRQLPGLAAVLAVAAAAVVAVTALLPGHQGRHQPGTNPGIELAAWTVVRHTDGTVDVTIRQLSAVPTAPPSGSTFETALPLRLSNRLRGTPSPGNAADSTRE